MKKWIILVVIAVLLGWAVYDFVDSKKEDEADDIITSEGDSRFTEDETTGDSSVTGIEKGNMAPDFELETTDGETVKLSDFRGQKVMLNFWATWCPPCRAEMPDIEKIHQNEEGVIVSVNLTETENSKRNVASFIDEFDLTFPILMDEKTKVATTYKAQALPTSYLINSKGEIHNIAVGPLNYEQMVQAFDEME